MNSKQFQKMFKEEKWKVLLDTAWNKTGCGSLYCMCDAPDGTSKDKVPIEKIRDRFFQLVELQNMDMAKAEKKWNSYVSSKMKHVQRINNTETP